MAVRYLVFCISSSVASKLQDKMTAHVLETDELQCTPVLQGTHV